MKICICDDEQITVKEIRALLKPFNTAPDSFAICEFSRAEDLLSVYRSGDRFDIIFIDIELSGINGMEAAKTIRDFDPDAIIIFISGHPNYIFDAFKIEALHFLLKPVKEAEFSEVFTRALKKHNAANANIVLKWESTRNKIPIGKITYIEGYRRHLTVHTIDSIFESVGKISEIYEILIPHGFVRVHQGFVVNMNFIKSFNSTDVELTDGSKVAVSVRKRHEALKAFDTFIRKWGW